ncbi:MAG TPA: hypothetical protein VFX43_07590 [Chitinophagaceae bacterium]|nr:hypothetical protein [Chitinophagaceae bacterium]
MIVELNVSQSYINSSAAPKSGVPSGILEDADKQSKLRLEKSALRRRNTYQRLPKIRLT